jgi:hypothetical protein
MNPTTESNCRKAGDACVQRVYMIYDASDASIDYLRKWFAKDIAETCVDRKAFETLQGQYEMLAGSVSAVVNERDQLRARLTVCKYSEAEVDALVATLADNRRAASDALVATLRTKHEAEVTTLKQQLEEARKSNADFQARFRKLLVATLRTKHEVTALKQQLEEAHNLNEDFQLSLRKLAGELENKDKTITSQLELVNELEVRLQQKSAVIKKHQTPVAVDEAFQWIRNRNAYVIARQRAHIASLRETLAQKQAEISELQQAQRELEEEIAKLKSADASTGLIRVLHTRLATQGTTIERDQAELAELRETLRKEQQQNMALRNSLDAEAEANHKLRGVIDYKNSLVEAYTSRAAELLQQLEKEKKSKEVLDLALTEVLVQVVRNHQT